MAVVDRFQDPNYVNWLKAGQALLCTAKGICDFCEGPIKQYHQVLHNKFPWKPCKGSCGENNQLCAVCAHRRGDWKKEIPSQLNPRTKPCWGNANMDMWERNAWQIAKVFMTYGQETRTGPSDTDPIGLLQLVINCKLFTSCVTNMKSFEDVKEIRNKVFHSADFKLSSTELDDYIKAMTTLLEDPMQLKTDAKAKKAVLLLQQIKTFPLETNDTQVLQTERTMWKTKIEEMSKGHSLTEKEVKNVLDFISKQEDLNETFKDDIEPLNKTVEELKAVQQLQGRNVSQLQLQQQQQGRDVSQLQLQLQQQGRDVSQLKEQGNELVVWVTKSENAQKETQEKQAEQQKQHESLVGKQAELDERVTKVEDIVKRPANIKEELQKLKEQLRDAQQRKIQKYLKNTKFFKNIALEKFSDLYVEPHVYESGEYKRLETRSDINSLQLEMKIEQCKQVKVEELLSPDPDRGMTALKVLITGSAGSGKSMLSLQLLNMWLQGQLPAFEDIFFYSMKELSIVKGSSLADLLFMHQYIYKRPSDEVAIEYVQQMSQNTLVVFEGLDAFGGYSSESETFDCNQDIEMSRLIGSIISGNTLKLVTLLVTSRPGGVNDYKKFDRVAEIYGFVEPMIDEYVHKYCEGDDMLEYHIGSYIDSNINVSSLCHLPIFCSLVCRIGKVGLLRDQKAPFPTTLTQLVTKYVDIFVREQHPRFTEKELRQRDNVIAEIKDQLLHHSKLAKDGMCHQPVKLNFSNEDVKELSQQAATQCGFLNVSKEKKQATVHAKVTQSYFVHLMMQEFFAAIALVSSLEETEKLLKQTPNEGQLDMVLTFISGLVGDPESRPFLESLGYNTITKAANPENQKILEAMGYKTIVTASELLGLVVTQCVINERKPRRRNHKASILLLLRLVYESRQPYLWSEIKDFVLNGGTELDLSDTPITSDELQALTFVVQKSSDITSVDLRNCKKTGDCGTHIGKLLQLRLEIRQ